MFCGSVRCQLGKLIFRINDATGLAQQSDAHRATRAQTMCAERRVIAAISIVEEEWPRPSPNRLDAADVQFSTTALLIFGGDKNKNRKRRTVRLLLALSVLLLLLCVVPPSPVVCCMRLVCLMTPITALAAISARLPLSR